MKPEISDHSIPGHEVTPMRARPFVIGGVSFFVAMGVILTVVGFLTVSWTHRTWPPHGPVRGPQAKTDWNNAAPQLQVNGPLDLEHLRQVEYRRLHAVEWTDDSHAFATIPIDRAMALMVQAEANGQLNQLLPEPRPATSVELQDQKSGAASSPPSAPSPGPSP